MCVEAAPGPGAQRGGALTHDDGVQQKRGVGKNFFPLFFGQLSGRYIILHVSCEIPFLNKITLDFKT